MTCINYSFDTSNLLLQYTPSCCSIFIKIYQFLLSHHCDFWNIIYKLLLRSIEFSCFFYWNPLMSPCISWTTYSKWCFVGSYIDILVLYYYLFILNKLTLTNYRSSQQFKKTLWSTPLGIIYKTWYNLVLLICCISKGAFP